jgi:heme A synthase
MRQTDGQRKSKGAASDAATPRTEKPALWLWSQYILDAVAWVVAILLALVLRYELLVSEINAEGVFVFCAAAVAAQLLVGLSFALYRGRYSFGSFHEAKLLVIVTVIVSVLLPSSRSSRFPEASESSPSPSPASSSPPPGT